MAATYTFRVSRPASTEPREIVPARSWNQSTWHGILLLITFATLIIHGYHPFAEDGGLYVAGIEYLLHPALFSHYTLFVTAHLHYSIFASVIADSVRVTHLSLTWVLFLTYIFSLWLTLYAGRQILRRCFTDPVAQFMGIALFATWATLPVAGTSLLLMDPYLTARTFSTPLSLLAIAFALDHWTRSPPSIPQVFYLIKQPAFLCALCLLLAILFHPLMASYAIAMVVVLRLLRMKNPRTPLCVLTLAIIATATLLNYLAPPESPAIVAAAISRYYWFLSKWKWYELCGLVGPLCILLIVLRAASRKAHPAVHILCIASIFLASLAVLVSLLFAHEHGATHIVARFQPLRGFLLIYALMPLLIGSSLTLQVRKGLPHLGVPMLAGGVLVSAGILFNVQRATFPTSQHIEAPWSAPENLWSQAFRYCNTNTPTNALFALDANYITTPGEDAQAFRATAQRSSLPDFSKDGGEASITPTLSDLWQRGAQIQTNLSAQPDAVRDANLKPLGVTWMVLHADSATAHSCPYNNGIVKICSLAP